MQYLRNEFKMYWIFGVSDAITATYQHSSLINGSIKKYSRASLSISGDRCNVTATMPTQRRNMKLVIIPIAKLTPRVLLSFKLKKVMKTIQNFSIEIITI